MVQINHCPFEKETIGVTVYAKNEEQPFDDETC